MDIETWWATVHWATKESDMTKELNNNSNNNPKKNLHIVAEEEAIF